MSLTKRVTTAGLRKMKKEGTPIAMITAYDYPSARFAEEAGTDMILVGDSLANVVLGYDSTLQVTLDDMIYHTKAVTRAVSKSFVVTDMPFMTYHGNIETTLNNAARIMREGLAKGVKMEGGAEIAGSMEACVKAGVPVMGHLGFTPQSVHQLGGFFVQGRTPKKANKLLEDARILEQAGAFAIVLELVPEPLARIIAEQISVPIIGIGAGNGCDGQVLVFHDLLQYGAPNDKKFVKAYANVGEQIRSAVSDYVAEVKNRQFPEAKHSFTMDSELVAHLYGNDK
jgi:3-methyl-2-oxobutanoate hydroxymethyltransferase